MKMSMNPGSSISQKIMWQSAIGMIGAAWLQCVIFFLFVKCNFVELFHLLSSVSSLTTAFDVVFWCWLEWVEKRPVYPKMLQMLLALHVIFSYPRWIPKNIYMNFACNCCCWWLLCCLHLWVVALAF